MKSRWLEKAAAVLCALCLAVGVMSGAVFARDEGNDSATGEITVPEATFVILDETLAETSSGEARPVPTPEVTDNRNVLPVYVNGERAFACVLLDGVPYAAPEDFCAAIGMDMVIEAAVGSEYFVCNGRCFPVEGGVPTVGGQLRLPVETLSRCFGVRAVWDRVQWLMTIEAEGCALPESGDTWYNETDLYWLSRVVYAEAGNQSIDGQAAVADVVLNRVASEAFADQNSVYDVIFAKNQFEVVANGMIYMEPSESAVIAAKLALEGYNVAGDATYFSACAFGEGYECVAWIGDYCFMTAA